jgi:hypothetical protein
MTQKIGIVFVGLNVSFRYGRRKMTQIEMMGSLIVGLLCCFYLPLFLALPKPLAKAGAAVNEVVSEIT